MKELKKDKLDIKIYDTRLQMGRSAAVDVSEYIRSELKVKPELNIIFAAAPSQNEFLEALLQQDIDWTKINAFHMDEYIGLSEDAPQRFGNFLKESIFKKVNLKKVHYLYEEGQNSDDIGRNYTTLLKENPIDITFMGIGENGHIAFNDPHVAKFDDKEMVKIVDLDFACRTQQVNDGCFSSIDNVPTHALTLTVPMLMKSQRIFCIVPGINKANAVKATIKDEITEQCPASILRTHDNATLYCDTNSAKYI